MSDVIKILPGRKYELNVYDDRDLMTHKIVFMCNVGGFVKYFNSDLPAKPPHQSIYIEKMEVAGEFSFNFVDNEYEDIEAQYRIIERVDISALGICNKMQNFIGCKTEDRPTKCLTSYYKKCV